MMNPKQQQQTQNRADPKVLQFKRAAILLCQKTGDNPDMMLQMPHEKLAGVIINVPFWYMVAEKMYGLSLMLQAIKQARDEMKAANDEAAAAKEAKPVSEPVQPTAPVRGKVIETPAPSGGKTVTYESDKPLTDEQRDAVKE